MGNVHIEGASGRVYKFRAYALNTKFANLAAIYFITSRQLRPDGRVSHSRIYCGQTSDLSMLRGSIQQILDIRKFHANCVCILPRLKEAIRMEIERDIRQKYTLLFKNAV